MEEKLIKSIVNWIYKNPMIVSLGIVFLEIAIVVAVLLFVNFVMA